ncbi:hypothetical protein [Aquimarina sp. I32.4]|uniref:hypothetical protein n=1 Tax=Aquimarina sp. I32.4 TaxID=2053903 RepID=UPI000CDE8E58|nr:hypothetical protein [Aquimarina sp. I32.4]
MEGKYTKTGTIVGIVAVLITVWQINKNKSSEFQGEWIMTSEIQDSQMSNYIGMNIEWVLHITQNGQELEGTGEKIKVNNIKLNYIERTNLRLKGSINGKQFIINYIENGKQRQTSGIFKGQINENIFQGEFSQTAADSKGAIYGIKKK